MWSGYQGLPPIQKLIKLVPNKRTLHVSRHVAREDLERMIQLCKPDNVLIIHMVADEKEKLLDVKARIIELNDKEEYVL